MTETSWPRLARRVARRYEKYAAPLVSGWYVSDASKSLNASAFLRPHCGAPMLFGVVFRLRHSVKATKEQGYVFFEGLRADIHSAVDQTAGLIPTHLARGEPVKQIMVKRSHLQMPDVVSCVGRLRDNYLKTSWFNVPQVLTRLPGRRI